MEYLETKLVMYSCRDFERAAAGQHDSWHAEEGAVGQEK